MEGHLTEYPQDPRKAWHQLPHLWSSAYSALYGIYPWSSKCLLEKLMVTFQKRLRHLIQIHRLVNLHRSIVMHHRWIQVEVGQSRIKCLRPVGILVLRRLRFHATVLLWTVGSIILLSSIGGHWRFRHCSWCSLHSNCCTCTGAGAGNLGGVAIKPRYLGCPTGLPKVRGVPAAKARHTRHCCCWKTDDISYAT